MTTHEDTGNPQAAESGVTLTSAEVAALKAVGRATKNKGMGGVYYGEVPYKLFEAKLIQSKVINNAHFSSTGYVITDAGHAALAAASAPADEDTRATEITANQWNRVAVAVKEGRAVVHYCHLGVTDVNHHFDDMYMIHGKWWSEELGTTNGHLLANKDDLLEVEWLPKQPAQPATAPTAEAKSRETEETLRLAWREYRVEARKLGLEPEEFIEYLIRCLNIAEESTYQEGYSEGYVAGWNDGVGDPS